MYKELFANGQEGRAAATAVVLLLATIPVMAYNIRKFRHCACTRNCSPTVRKDGPPLLR